MERELISKKAIGDLARTETPRLSRKHASEYYNEFNNKNDFCVLKSYLKFTSDIICLQC